MGVEPPYNIFPYSLPTLSPKPYMKMFPNSLLRTSNLGALVSCGSLGWHALSHPVQGLGLRLLGLRFRVWGFGSCPHSLTVYHRGHTRAPYIYVISVIQVFESGHSIQGLGQGLGRIRKIIFERYSLRLRYPKGPCNQASGLKGDSGIYMVLHRL